VPVLVAHFVFRRFQGLWVHSNVHMSLGPLRYVIASPEFHHWHHATDPAAFDTNFAGEVPLVDWLFGTLHLPPGQWPETYGIDEEAPGGYLAQLLWPFRRTLSALAA
jgi:sterol desaturase/sphingolipid hydroxylase (fatty acid hydroxylase superfamily)